MSVAYREMYTNVWKTLKIVRNWEIPKQIARHCEIVMRYCETGISHSEIVSIHHKKKLWDVKGQS